MKKQKRRPKCPLWQSDAPAGLCPVYDDMAAEIERLKKIIDYHTRGIDAISPGADVDEKEIEATK